MSKFSSPPPYQVTEMLTFDAIRISVYFLIVCVESWFCMIYIQCNTVSGHTFTVLGMKPSLGIRQLFAETWFSIFWREEASNVNRIFRCWKCFSWSIHFQHWLIRVNYNLVVLLPTIFDIMLCIFSRIIIWLHKWVRLGQISVYPF